MGVFPADHVIGKPREYAASAAARVPLGAAQGKIVVLGIQPRWAETGYGYIEFPRGRSSRFGRAFARPALPRKARRGHRGADSCAAGNFYWNAGMFFWRASVSAGRAAQVSAEHRGTAGRPARVRFADSFAARMRETFPHCENISIDYAVLEQAPERGRLRRRRYRLERRGELERGVRAADARRARQRAAAATPWWSDSRATYVDADGSWWRCWA